MNNVGFIQLFAKKLLVIRKFIFILCLLLVVQILYQLILLPPSIQPQHSFANINLLIIVWLLLLNLMISIFGNFPAKTINSLPIFERFKAKVKQWIYVFLSFVFIGMTLVVVFLSFRMLRV